MTDPQTRHVGWPLPLRWQRANRKPAVSEEAALLTDGAVYELGGSGLAAFSLQDGRPLWVNRSTGPLLGANDDLVLTHPPGDNTVLVGLSPKDGTERWAIDVPGELVAFSRANPAGSQVANLDGVAWVQLSTREDNGISTYRASVTPEGSLGELQRSRGGRMVGWGGKLYAASGRSLHVFDGEYEQRFALDHPVNRVSIGFDGLLALFRFGYHLNDLFDVGLGRVIGEVSSAKTATHALAAGRSVFLDANENAVCREVPSLEEQWRLDVKEIRPYSIHWLAPSHVLVAGVRGIVVDATTGEPRSEVIDGLGRPIVGNNLALLRFFGHHLCLELPIRER